MFYSNKEALVNYVDILTAAKRIISESFPTAQFAIDGLHKPPRQDVTNKSSDLLVYVRLYLSLLQLTKHIIGHATVCL